MDAMLPVHLAAALLKSHAPVQAATAAAPPGAGAQSPMAGDGLTFEHLAEREFIWLDFVADIGDGGDPTYAVACCMAAPTLLATLPANLADTDDAGLFIPATALPTLSPLVISLSLMLRYMYCILFENLTQCGRRLWCLPS